MPYQFNVLKHPRHDLFFYRAIVLSPLVLTVATLSTLLSGNLAASNAEQKSCFVVANGSKTLVQKGDCTKRHSPKSTFKVALSLMGFDANILINDSLPNWQFKEGYVDWLEQWKQPHTPRQWIQNSCVWYSHILTQKLGPDLFERYVKQLQYGNKDVSGDIALRDGVVVSLENGPTNAWLSSSLEISPMEQLNFMLKLWENKLPVSKKAQALTRSLMYIEDLSDGWSLYGKTGNGPQLSSNRTKKLDIQAGWFIGWIQHPATHQQVRFVRHIVDSLPNDHYASFRAKEQTKTWLQHWIKTKTTRHSEHLKR